MKTVVKQTPSFTPVNINITLETKEELHLFCQIMIANVRIPDMLVDDGSIEHSDKGALTEIMINIYRGSLETIYHNQ
jgi:hypothetical protein